MCSSPANVRRHCNSPTESPGVQGGRERKAALPAILPAAGMGVHESKQF